MTLASAQRPAEELSGGGPGQLADELEALWHLETGERARAVATELVGACLGAVAEDDDGLDRLLPLGVGAADRGGVGDGGMAQEDLLDLGRQHVLTAGDDHVAEPVGDVEE